MLHRGHISILRIGSKAATSALVAEMGGKRTLGADNRYFQASFSGIENRRVAHRQDRSSARLLVRSDCGQVECETHASWGQTVSLDGAPMRLDDRSANCEADTHPGLSGWP